MIAQIRALLPRSFFPFRDYSWIPYWYFFWDFSAFNNTGRSYVEDQLVSLSMATACTTTMHDRICLVSCRHLSSLATWPASAMHSSWCLGWWASTPPCSLSATYTNPSSANELFVGRWRAAELYLFLVPLRSPNIEKVSSRVQQEQLEIAVFQIRPLFIGTGNAPINLLCLCVCCDKNRLSLRPMYYPLVTSDSNFVGTMTCLNICGRPMLCSVIFSKA